MENQLVSVSDFIAITNQTLDYAYPSVAIEGEVASFKVNSGKYIFFDLKDEESSVSCFMMLFAQRFPIEDGMKVIVVASPKLTNWGKFSLTVKAIKPSGEGALKRSFELLKAKLEKEGLFSPDRKRQLPFPPHKIAVVSSTAAAGYADFIKIISDRWSGLEIEVANVQVQGASAADQIVSAIEYFNNQEHLADVIAILRGGGSADDLASFNDEKLVRAIASSRIPTIVGVGHETDESLADLAADVRASTPSNAAQILVPDKKELIKLLDTKLYAVIDKIEARVRLFDGQTGALLEKSLRAIDNEIDTSMLNIKLKKDLIEELNPKKVLNRGYAIIRGLIVKGSDIEIETKSNILKANIKEVYEK